MKKLVLGSKAKDKVTGFTGIVTGHAKYLTGCDQYLLNPECEDPGKYPEGKWFDENRLAEQPGTTLVLDTGESKGACDAAPQY